MWKFGEVRAIYSSVYEGLWVHPSLIIFNDPLRQIILGYTEQFSPSFHWMVGIIVD